MKREQFDIAASIVDRMDKLENTIFKLQEIQNKKSYKIVASISDQIQMFGNNGTNETSENFVDLNAGEIATEVFIQDILEYYINILNLELDELRKSFESI